MTDANEMTHYKFISTILHVSITIVKNLIFQDIFIILQKDISDKDATSQVDYVIKSLKNLLYITERKLYNIKIKYVQVSLFVFLIY